MGSQGTIHRGMKFIQKSAKTTATISLPNGASFYNQISLTLNNPGLLMAEIHRATWLDNDDDGNNWLPYGANIDLEEFLWFPVDRSYYTIDDGTLSELKDNISQSILVIKNKSGATHDFICDGLIRFIINRLGTGDI